MEGAFRFEEYGVPTTDSSGRLFAVGAAAGQVIDLETGELVFIFDGGNSTLSGDGSLLIARGHEAGRPLELWDLTSQARLWAIENTFTRAWFSSDENLVYAISRDGSTYVFDTTTGEQIMRLASQGGRPLAAVMSTDGRRLAAFSTDFTARVWDLGAMRSEAGSYVTNSQPRVHTAASADLVGGVAAVWGGAARQEDALWETTVVDLSNGETLASVQGGVPALSPDGTRLAYRAIDEVEVFAEDLKVPGATGGIRPRVGPINIIDTQSGELLLEIDVPCEQYLTPTKTAPAADCLFESGGAAWDLEFSPDGRMLGIADSHDGFVTIWDSITGEVVARPPELIRPRAIAFSPTKDQVAFVATDVFLEGPSGETEPAVFVYDIDPVRFVSSIRIDEGTSVPEMVFSADGSVLVVAASSGDLLIIDATSWEPLDAIAAHRGSALDVASNTAGTVIASAGADAYVRVWSLPDRSLVTEIKFDVDEIANVEFIDDTHLFVTPGLGDEAIVITLDPDELLAIAQSRLTRSFTTDECSTYRIDPCPTLNDIRSGSAQSGTYGLAVVRLGLRGACIDRARQPKGVLQRRITTVWSWIQAING